MAKQDEYINKMYDTALEQQKAGLQQDYDNAVAQLDGQQEKAGQQAQANLSRTYVEAEKARRNQAEMHNAYGLSSGAMAQARLAQDNQTAANMTAIRTAQQEADASIARERDLLGKEYANAIREAQANNDLARAEALYKAAQEEEARLLAKQEGAANLMGNAGDYSRLGQLYGLTAEEIRILEDKANRTQYSYSGGNDDEAW